MVENINLMTFIYILIIILLIVLIVLSIKAIFLVKDVNDTLDDLNYKLHSLDGIFNIIAGVSNAFDSVNDKITTAVGTGIRTIKRWHDKKD